MSLTFSFHHILSVTRHSLASLLHGQDGKGEREGERKVQQRQGRARPRIGSSLRS